MKLIIGGDVVPTEVTEKYFISGDISATFGKTAELCKSADRVIVNVECALTEYDGAIRKMGPNIKASPDSGSKDVFVLHEGTSVRVVRTLDKWSEITIADGNKGWLNSNSYRLID